MALPTITLLLMVSGITTYTSLQDRRRIKQHGPTEEDLTERYTAVADIDEVPTEIEAEYIPSEVLGSAGYDAEPQWHTLPRTEYMEFYHGLRQRNWTSKYHDPTAQPWNLKFFKDSGRLLVPSYPGYRVLITKADGSQCWADLPVAGTETFVKDHIQAVQAVPGTAAQLDQLRVPQDNIALSEWGYKQVFEQLFQAYEQQVPKAVKRQLDKKGHVDLSKYKYNCPGDALGVSFHMTPQAFNFQPVLDKVPGFAVIGGGFLFIAVSLFLGIFR